MSAGGFIAQALLGGTQQAAQGIGNKIREEAKLKRQQALDGTRTENDKAVATHSSELAQDRQSSQNEYSAQESGRQRDHELALADKKYGQQRDLIDYNMKAELNLARKKAETSGSLTEWQTANLDRINSDIDNLQKMERDLMTGKSDGMEISLTGLDPESQPQDAAGKLAIIRQRLKAKELSFNRVLGNQKGVDAGAAILAQAANITDPADRKEFMADLKGSKVYSEDLARDIQEVWGSESRPTQPTEQPPVASQPSQEGSPQTPPQRGMISEASEQSPSAAPAVEPSPLPATEERSAPNPQPQEDTNAGKPVMEQTLGPMIERGAKAIGSKRDEFIQRRANESIQEMQNLAIQNRTLTPQEKVQFLQRHGQYIKNAPPEIQEQMLAIFGQNMLTPYLN